MNVPITELVGKTFSDVRDIDSERVVFYIDGDEAYTMLHIQDCCESVYLEDIDNDLSVLIDTEILEARESTNHDQSASAEWQDDSFTWTFYKFRTAKGWLTMRWYGSSNGYYSESVDIIKA